MRLEHLLSRDKKKKLFFNLDTKLKKLTLAVNSKKKKRLKIQSLVAQLVRVLH